MRRSNLVRTTRFGTIANETKTKIYNLVRMTRFGTIDNETKTKVSNLVRTTSGALIVKQLESQAILKGFGGKYTKP